MTIKILAELAVVLVVIALGARVGGVGLGLWGAVGVFVLAAVFGVAPAAPPVDVMLIILAVIMAAATMEVAGGIDRMVALATRIIRRHPRRVTFVAPVVAYLFTFAAGTGHVFYPLLPVIYEVAYDNGVRPERPIAVATIASQQAITASPVSAAMAAMIVIFAPHGLHLTTIMAIAVPATLVGVLVAALVQTRIGKDLRLDPEVARRIAAGELAPPGDATISAAEAVAEVRRPPEERRRARISVWIFLVGVAAVVVSGAFPELRPVVPVEGGDGPLGMAATIEIVMMAAAALILLVTRADAAAVPRSPVARSGVTAMVGIFGLAWLGDSFIKANEAVLIGGLGDIAKAHPPLFALGLFAASVLLFSQASTTKALMPLGLTLGLPPAQLVAMWPAVNGYFFLPTYGTIIAALSFDRSGTTRIGRFVLNHSFMLPGLVATVVAVALGFAIAPLV